MTHLTTSKSTKYFFNTNANPNNSDLVIILAKKNQRAQNQSSYSDGSRSHNHDL